MIPQHKLVNVLPTENILGVTSRAARPKYRSYSSQPCRTTSSPPCWLVVALYWKAWSSRLRSSPATLRIREASESSRHPPSDSGGGKYAPAPPALAAAEWPPARLYITG